MRTFGYLGLMAGSALLSFGKNLAFARLLGPAEYAYYAALDLVLAFGMYAGTAGLLEGLNRELPLALGAGRARRARALTAHAAGATLAVSVAALALFSLIVFASVADARLRASLLAGGVLSVVNNLFLLATLLLVTAQRPLAFAAAMFCRSGLALAAGSALGLRFGLAGVIGAEIGAATLLAAWLSYRLLPGLRWPRAAVLRGTFATGLPLLGGAVVANLSRNLDRFFVAGTLGVAAFGQYSFALLAALGWSVVLNALTQYLTPRVCHAVGAGSSLDRQRRRLDRIVFSCVGAGVVAYVAFAAALEWAGPLFFPGFEQGFDLMRVTYFGGLLQLFFVYQSLLIAAGATGDVLKQAVIVSLFSAVLCLVGFWRAAPVPFFAVAFLAHRLAAAALALSSARRVSLA